MQPRVAHRVRAPVKLLFLMAHGYFPEAAVVCAGEPNRTQVTNGKLRTTSRNRTGGSEEAASKNFLYQKDFESATIQAAPVTRQGRANSDQLKCASE